MLASEEALLDYYKSCGVDFLCSNTKEGKIANKYGVAQVSQPQVLANNLQENKQAYAAKPINVVTQQNAAIANILPENEFEKLISEANNLAQKAENIEQLANILKSFAGPAYSKNSKNCLFYDGQASNKVLVIKDMPYAEEERNGQFLLGEEGELITKMLEAIDLDKSQYVIANTVFWRTPGQRNLKASEIDICRPFLLKLVQLMQPSAVFIMGSTPVYSLLQLKESILKIRGQVYQEHNTKIMPSLSVQALITNPSMKKNAWEDLKKFKDIIAN